MYPFWQEPGIDRSLRIVGCSGLQFVKSTNVVMVEPATSSLVDMHWNQGKVLCAILYGRFQCLTLYYVYTLQHEMTPVVDMLLFLSKVLHSEK